MKSHEVKYWKTKDGRKIKIVDMTTSHITNSINLLKRVHARYIQETPYPVFNGEMAQFYADRDWLDLVQSTPKEMFPVIEELEEELKKRKRK